MKIEVNVDRASLLSRFENGHKRLAFGVVNALNRTAKLVQSAEVEETFGDLTVRQPAFIRRRAAKIAFASVRQGRAFADIFIDSSRLQGSPLLLPGLQEGGQRSPVVGKSAAVPVIGGPARPSFASPVPRALTFKQLRLKPMKGSKATTGDVRRAGALGTYQVPGVGVFQREAGRESRMLYAFVPDEQLPDRLDFVKVGERVALEWFPRYLEDEIRDAYTRRGLAVPTR